MAGKNRVRNIQGAILERIDREEMRPYENFSERLAEELVDTSDKITKEKFHEVASEIQTDFFKFNEIEDEEKFLDKVYRDIERFFS